MTNSAGTPLSLSRQAAAADRCRQRTCFQYQTQARSTAEQIFLVMSSSNSTARQVRQRTVSYRPAKSPRERKRSKRISAIYARTIKKNMTFFPLRQIPRRHWRYRYAYHPCSVSCDEPSFGSSRRRRVLTTSFRPATGQSKQRAQTRRERRRPTAPFRDL